MATYYHGNSELQGGNDGLQTLILMNPGYTGYSDGQPSQQGGNNLVFFNSNNSGNPLNLPHTPPPMQAQRFLGVPLPGSHTGQSSQDQNDISALQGFVQRGQYNFYSPTIDFTAGRETPRTQQGLSLSLSPQQTAYGAFRLEREGPSQQAMVTTTVSPTNGGSGGSSSSASGVSNSVNGMRNVLLNHKYLKAAQELLDEVVNVGKEVKNGVESSKNKNIGESSMAPSGVAGDVQSGRDTGGGKRSAELSTAERQEIQMKKAKLVNMLDEVEQRYRQYHQQMQIVITWFEQAAGIGAAKTYTALALQTISKQFRCLKDAILGQIRAASKSLGEEDSFGGKMEGSRLKFVDNQLRQQRALQQLGMIQHNAWRPQRGLPERSVSVLRAWLFEHFLHPYPKDSDKIMLAKQTGLTRSQVSNWFINARVRLWKPMVEEMYTEEMKEQEKNASEENTNSKIEDSTSKAATSSQDKSPGIENQIKSFMSKQEIISTTSPSPTGIEIQNHSGFNLIASSDMESISQGSPKKLMLMNGNEKPSRDGFALMGAPTNFIGGFGSYSMGELGRFDGDPFPGSYSGNGVSLTLGLPHCENLSMPGNYQTFLPNQLGRGDEIEENDVYESINIQNRKRFAAPLLPDFVS